MLCLSHDSCQPNREGISYNQFYYPRTRDQILLLLTLEMFGLLPETASDGYDSFSDLLADSGDFNSPSRESEIHSSASNESEDRPEQPIKNDRWHDYVLDMDDSDIDNVSRPDGDCEWTSMRATQIRIREALDEDITPHAPVNGQATKPAWCTGFFLTHISTDCIEGTHPFSASRQWSRIF
jgi:hypothetical protein